MFRAWKTHNHLMRWPISLSGFHLIVTFCLCGVLAQAQSGIPILTYHRFDPNTAGPTTVTIATFESQLDTLAANGYAVVPLETATDIVLGVTQAPTHPIAVITVDDGHYSAYTVLFPILKQRRIPVTLFIYPSAISNAPYALTWDQIREMLASGLVDVQSHTYWHPDFRKEKARRSAADFEAFVETQLSKSKTKLEVELGVQVDLLAWPYGIVDDELETAALRNGYRAAFAYDGKLARPGEDAFAIHRIPVSDSERGSSFAALLSGSPHNGKDHANVPRE